MTDREIKLEAKRRLKQNGAGAVVISFFSMCIPVFLLFCEVTVYLVLRNVGWAWLYYPQSLVTSHIARTYWIFKLILLMILLLPEKAVLRRIFIDVVAKGDIFDSRQFIFTHSASFYMGSFYSAFIYNLVKFFMFLPAVIGSYGAYHWWRLCRVNDLTSPRLFLFMLSMGFTVIWLGIFVHYCISLSLTPYIMALNPRSNVFDACDLSVRLMDGHHLRYIAFIFSFLKYIPAFIFVYPVFVFYPYFKVSYLILMEDILGDYWRDKMPGMIKRWKKYLD